MAVILGKNSALYWDGTKMARINTFDLSINGVVVDVSELGDNWESNKNVIQNWAANVTGYFDLDNTEQNALFTRMISGGEIVELEFYETEGGYYWTPDTGTDPEAMCTVESYNWTVDKSNVILFTASIKGSGPIHRTS